MAEQANRVPSVIRRARRAVAYRARLLRPGPNAVAVASLLVAAVAVLAAQLASLFADLPWVTDHVGELTLALVALLATYMVAERATVLRELEAGLRRPVVDVLSSQEETYLRVTQALRTTAPRRPADRTIELVSFHDRGREAEAFPTPDVLFEAWEWALSRRILEGWAMRWLVLINDVDRLDQVIARLQYHDAADRLEVRALVKQPVPTVLSPLLIARQDAFLAVDDTRHRKAGASLHLKGPEASSWVLEFFEQLWSSEPLFRLRTHRGTNEDQILRVRALLEHGGDRVLDSAEPGGPDAAES